ncbi:MAG: hemerythrin domain-containing protein [Candidatus Eisenbacteria bacterium]|uniref:Hemerythrin domain-containing protein n=1 Tax=Eiseniibacteriota bacterium TaxID=2212470 RepID=A0A849SHT2_UNCEI|nr:hemerythrin domain-containing protein [Candidatus Eisenbacteria bacterium]
MSSEIDDLEQRLLGGEAAVDEGFLCAALARLASEFATHMAAEDFVLYPALHAAFPAGRGTLATLRNHHAELRLMLSTLFERLETPSSAARNEQIQVVLRDFIDLLRLHIHCEESTVFDVASRVLSNSEVERIARDIAPRFDSNSARDSEPGPSKGIST